MFDFHHHSKLKSNVQISIPYVISIYINAYKDKSKDWILLIVILYVSRSPGGTPMVNKSRKRVASSPSNLTSVMYSALQEKFAVSLI